MTKKQIKNLCCERGFIFDLELADEMQFYKHYKNHKGRIIIIKDTFYNAYQLYDYYIVGKKYSSVESSYRLINDLTELQRDVSYLNNFIE